MKACPYCGEQIQDAAILCRHCGRQFVFASANTPPTTPVEPSSQSNRNAKLVGWLLVLAVVASIILSQLEVPELVRTAGEVYRSPSARTPERLELLASTGRRSDGGDYMKVEGQVKNISDRPIDAVVVVTSWYSENGTFIASDKGMVDFRPLLPGQTSPFSSLTRRNPVMSKYSVTFTTFGGTVINHLDSRK